MVTVAQVHEDFKSTEVHLIKRSKKLENQISKLTGDIIRTEREKALGFVDYIDPENKKKHRALDRTKVEMNQLKEYALKYPMYKFITESRVKKLCKKYGLVMGEISKYIGEIPEKNLVDMERNCVKKEDKAEKAMTEIMRESMLQSIGLTSFYTFSDSKKEVTPKKEISYYKPIMICSTPNLMNTEGMEIVEGYKLVKDDPIVLQPVKGGYLIITAWGAEASDEMVVNENNN